MNVNQEFEMRKVLMETFYAGTDAAYFDTPAGQHALDEHIKLRGSIASQSVIPWLSQISDLSGKKLV